ncbi:uncharacterized protein LOC129288732 [Prosopis cineraria]|uniref:uncharacterized protein LOC129287544 n=1 Tax=Prosopis cineraria TaxID=364024 RepID=UPI00240FF20F|nr:uncharacterized protein LOC129287544 [Prosopis cineraria]XP_054781438.1 uncharacterized protein LOC129288732 [Prosopis cineraria]
MGQVLDRLQDKKWRQGKIRKITDKAFESLKNEEEKAQLTFEDLYIAVLLVYNDLNKHLPGPHFDPPSKDRVKQVMKECDVNPDGKIDRDEFYEFIKRMTGDTFTIISQGMIVTLVVAPMLAFAAMRAIEGVPGVVGKVARKLPKSVYVSLITIALVALCNWMQRISYHS